MAHLRTTSATIRRVKGSGVKHGRPAWVWGLAVSVIVHGLFALSAVMTRRSVSVSAKASNETVRIEFRHPEPEVPPEPPKSVPLPPTRPVKSRSRPKPSPTPEPPPPKSPEPATPEAPARTPGNEEQLATQDVEVPDERQPGLPASGARASKGSNSGIGLVRDPSKLDLSVRPQVTPEDALLPPPPPPDPGPIARLKLKRTAGGGFLYTAPTFSAQIAPDGQVVIRDRLVKGVLSPGGIERGPGVQPLIIKPPMVGVKLDVTDLVMSAVGDDPYLHRKLTFLEETSDLRAELAAQACQQRLKKALYTLRSDLERIWDDAATPAKRRRYQLFRLWDDCAEATDDETVVGYAEQARATIIAFIRERLPQSSIFAYSTAELIALNRRRHSSVAFEPYNAFGE